MFMKQVLFSITLTEDKRYTFLQMYSPYLKFRYIYKLFYTLMFWVFRGLLANIVEVQKFYISFNLFYDSTSASACS